VPSTFFIEYSYNEPKYSTYEIFGDLGVIEMSTKSTTKRGRFFTWHESLHCYHEETDSWVHVSEQTTSANIPHSHEKIGVVDWKGGYSFSGIMPPESTDCYIRSTTIINLFFGAKIVSEPHETQKFRINITPYDPLANE